MSVISPVFYLNIIRQNARLLIVQSCRFLEVIFGNVISTRYLAYTILLLVKLLKSNSLFVWGGGVVLRIAEANR